jgi:5-formyltetrahydrofolate cyclo-ligase
MGNDVATKREKSGLRRKLIEARRNLTAAERRAKSLQILKSCRTLGPVEEAGVLCSFIGFGEEVLTSDFLRSLLQEGRRIAVPTGRAPGGEPSFSEIRSWEELTPNSMGILEPKFEALRLLPAATIPLFFVPGLAFDITGGRIGYGLGFYDRALAGVSGRSLLVGLSFDLQVVDFVPLAAHDRPMDMIVTENRIISASPCSRQREEVF